jgi:hypothetical protein
MEQRTLLLHAVEALESVGASYMVVGSYACIAYGEVRFTQDIDIVADFQFSQVNPFLSFFLTDDFYVSESAMRDAIRNSFQFNVLHLQSGNKLDFILPRKDQWGSARILRARKTRLLPNRDVVTASPEDVIIGKLWYHAEGGSDKHLRDIAGILRVTGDGVNRSRTMGDRVRIHRHMATNRCCR